MGSFRAMVRWELWQRRFSATAWTWGVSAYILLICAVFPGFVKNQNINLGRALERLPDTLKSFTNISGNFDTPSGFLGSEPYYVILPILFIILAINLGSNLLAREEAAGTLELLLSRPISRGRLLAAKALAGILLLAAVDVVAGGAMSLFTTLFHIHIGIALLWKVHLMLYLLALLFGALAFMLTAIGRAGRSAAMGITMVVAIGGYVLSSLESAIHWLQWPAKLLPYHYYQPSKILNGTFTPKPAVGYLIGVAVFGIVAYLAFRRRDIG